MFISNSMPLRDDILHWLTTIDEGERESLRQEADRIRREEMGDAVHLRGLIEFSNVCGRNCLYCGLRRDNTHLERYRMSADEIVAAAGEAVSLGYKSVVLQCGESGNISVDELSGVLQRIKAAWPLAITLSIGEKPRSAYAALRAAGADRFLLRFETSSAELFHGLKPDSSYEARFRCLEELRELGYQVGSGIMVGLPGQTMDLLADDILRLHALDLDMIGVGPFIPHPDTPLAGSAGGTLDLTLRVVSILRIVTRNTHIPATTAMGSIDPAGREKALQCGANVLMPNVTPVRYRQHYTLYPGKICLGEEASVCASCVVSRLAAIGRTVADGPGHSLKAAHPPLGTP